MSEQTTYLGFPTEWKLMAFHRCGNLIRDIPLNDIGFLIDFPRFCRGCGTSYIRKDLYSFTGKLVSTAVWWNPLTWFSVKLITRGE